MRFVLDTNVAVSALLWRGTSNRLFSAIRGRPDAQLFTSAALLHELADVLNRPFAIKRLALIGLSVREVLIDYALTVDVVSPASIPSVVGTDPDDDYVIAAAVAAHADLLVSGDDDVLRLADHQGIRIVGPAEALRLLTER